MRKHLLPVLLLVAAVWFLYFQTGSFEFLRLDDHDYTFRCAFVKDGLSAANVKEAFTNPRHAAIWMPVTYISYMADITLFGPGMGPHHLVNVALHTLNALLLYALLLTLLPRKPLGGTRSVASAAPTTPTPGGTRSVASAAPTTPTPGGTRSVASAAPTTPTPGGTRSVASAALALLATAFWALHPQRVEAVAWIAGRKELLCALFTLLGLHCWLRPGPRWTLAAILCCALACMSKPTAMCFPFLVFAVSCLNDTPNDATPTPPTTNNAPPKPRPLSAYLPLLALAVATGALAVYSQTHPEGRPELALFTASFPWRLLNAAVSTGLYLFQALVPVGLHLDYRATPGHFPLDGLLGLATLGTAALALGFLLYRTRGTGRQADGVTGTDATERVPPVLTVRRLLALLLFFCAALAPTLGIFGSFGEAARADRFFYLPSLALSFGLGFLIHNLVRAARRGRRALPSQPTPDHPPLVGADVLGRPSGVPMAPNRPPLVGADVPGRPLPPTPTALITLIALLALATLLVLVNFGAAFPLVASYRNDYTAFSRTLACDSDNGRALAHVASEECARFGRIDRGISLYRRSQELRPRDDTAAQLAYALALRGLSSDYAEIRRLCAKFACDHTLDRKGMALEALGTTAMRQRKWAEAISCLEDSIKAPQRFYSAEDALLRLGACYCNAGRTVDAIRVFEPLTQSRRTDIAPRARQFLDALKRNPKTVLFF